MDLGAEAADPGSQKNRRRPQMTDGAISPARKRPGGRVWRRMFQGQVKQIERQKDFHGLRTFAWDGTTRSIPDAKGNVAGFEVPKVPRGRGGYPFLKLVALVEVAVRRVCEVAIGLWRAAQGRPPTGETLSFVASHQ